MTDNLTRVYYELTTTVEQVTAERREDYIWLNCGHIVPTEHDESNFSLVGAETVCKRHFDLV
jgi:hypothetical protein